MLTGATRARTPAHPRGVAGDTLVKGDPNYQLLARAFAWLAAEPGRISYLYDSI